MTFLHSIRHMFCQCLLVSQQTRNILTEHCVTDGVPRECDAAVKIRRASYVSRIRFLFPFLDPRWTRQETLAISGYVLWKTPTSRAGFDLLTPSCDLHNVRISFDFLLEWNINYLSILFLLHCRSRNLRSKIFRTFVWYVACVSFVNIAVCRVILSCQNQEPNDACIIRMRMTCQHRQLFL